MMSDRAIHKLQSRQQPPTCYLFDMQLNGRYWHWWEERSIHNTGLITSWCAVWSDAIVSVWVLTLVGKASVPQPAQWQCPKLQVATCIDWFS